MCQVGRNSFNMSSENIDYRRLQLTGGSTYVISLPKDWIRENELGKGKIVGVERINNGDLRITASQDSVIKKSVCINLTKNEKGKGLNDQLIGAYLSGVDSIDICASTNISRYIKMQIRQFLRDTRGMEIEIDEDKLMRITSILDPTELRLQVSINRMYILILGLVTDAIDVLNGEDETLLSDIEDRERQIDARRLLLERQVSISLQSPNVEKKLKINKFAAMEHANIARVLERMGDHATNLAILVRDNQKSVNLKPNEYPIFAIPQWSFELKQIVHNTYTKDVNTILSSKRNLIKLMEEIEASESTRWSGKEYAEKLIAEFRISESIRRLCAYGINLAEALVNMVMHSKLEVRNE